LEFSTFLGGWYADGTWEVLPDDARDEIVAIGWTDSVDFPVRQPLQPWSAGEEDTTIVRLSADGREMLFGSYLGGSYDEGYATAALDSRGRLVVAGNTSSPDFPTTPDALQREFGGGDYDGYLAVLRLDPPSLDYATFLGGSRGEGIVDVTVDGEGKVWLVGGTESVDFPTGNGVPFTLSGSLDVLLVRVDVDTPKILLSLLLGGGGYDMAYGVAVDGDGAAIVVGGTVSPDFPLRRPLQDHLRAGLEEGEGDGFIAKISPVDFPREPRVRLRSAPH
jgi:hypothetical protein